MHLRTAEAVFLNGGRQNFNNRSRYSRFYSNRFSGDILNQYRKRQCKHRGCTASKKRGSHGTFLLAGNYRTVQRRQRITGVIIAISCSSDNNTRGSDVPLKFICPVHGNMKNVNIWVKRTDNIPHNGKLFVRCSHIVRYGQLQGARDYNIRAANAVMRAAQAQHLQRIARRG